MSSAQEVRLEGDNSESPYIFRTNRLPPNVKEMTSIGNGHVATRVFSDTVYMNGLYNGFGGGSHRARIPSRNNIGIRVEETVQLSHHTFTLNAKHGVFTEEFSTPTHLFQFHTFAHRYFHKVIVNQIYVRRTSASKSSLTLSISNDPGVPSDDIEFESTTVLEIEGTTAYLDHGHTVEVENSKYQFRNSTVSVMATQVPNSVTVTPDTEEAIYTYFAAYDTNAEGVLSDFHAVAIMAATLEGQQKLYESHATSWKSIWENGRIEIGGNLNLAKIVNGAMYYIISSLPVTTETNSPIGPFYGLSPSGLGYGALGTDYQGHSFWDTEMWMFPVVLNFYPTAARELLNYRVRNFKAAQDHAKGTGWEGARFPWESAFTGSEVTPDRCPAPRKYQIHVTGDISFAIKQYFSSTNDTNWLNSTNRSASVQGSSNAENSNPCNLVRAMAEFWHSRGSFNAQTNKYDINGVMPPDEDHYPVNNSIYTNAIASQSIFFAKYLENVCSEAMEPIPSKWLEFARSLTFLFDPTLNFHPEYEGYKIGQPIKQADVVLLGYPLLCPMNATIRRNDLKNYEDATRSSGPAMTWVMHAIGHLELNEVQEAENLFLRSYEPYLREPFKTWTESSAPKFGANNFITGMGGFLQAIVNGYGGLRLHPDKLVLRPRLPPNSTTLELIGLKYLGASLNVILDKRAIRICETKTSNVLLTLEANNDSYVLNDSKEVILSLKDEVIELTIRGPNSLYPAYPD